MNKRKEKKAKNDTKENYFKNCSELNRDTQKVISQSLAIVSLSKQPTGKERRNSILMM